MKITGTDAGESLTGTTAGDTIKALGGDDTVQAGAGDDTVDGGTGNDTLYGEDGDDTLDGGIGKDTLNGGTGDDTYFVDNAGDVVTEGANEGLDHIYAHLGYTLGANVEDLTLIGTGNYSAAGNDLNNTITGNGANNRIDGGLGADVLIGGSGNDTYIVDNTGDIVAEYGGEGTDSVESSVSYVLTDDLENLTLTGVFNRLGTGNTMGNLLTGNAGNNALRGLDGNDVLNGGLGADSLYGGNGNDTFVVDNAGDKVFDYTGQGMDTVMASVSFGLSGTAIENLTLTGTGDINAQGNGLDNLLTGNSGNNVLSGGGGTDTMVGGKGNDTYRIDDLSDSIVELANGGTDTVVTGLNYSLVDTQIENLTLSGMANVNGTGNGANNVLTGNAGNNVLDGSAGKDTMVGGAGNDTYWVDNSGDTVTELSGQGTDIVYSRVSFSLSGGFVENLTLMGALAANVTGNGLDNILTGNASDNVLTGGGGADTLIGGARDDVYWIDASDTLVELAGGGVDTVVAPFSIDLANYANFENATLSGSADLNLTGHDGSNKLTGNAGNNVLDGGAGVDHLSGGAGDDSYYVDTNQDVVIELAGGGNDTIYATSNYNLGGTGDPATHQVENLVLLAGQNAYGNALGNMIVGNAAANNINGSFGDDQLTGGAGADAFTFTQNAGNDVVTDFSAAEGDTINFRYVGANYVVTQVGSDAVITINGMTVTVLNTNATDSAFLSHIHDTTPGG